VDVAGVIDGDTTATVDMSQVASSAVDGSKELLDFTDVLPADAGNVGAAMAVEFTMSTASATVLSCTKTIDSLTISAHGIFLYNDLPANFFNAYTTYTYGGPNIRTPDDCGVLLVPFCLYPGTYQPSSHVNVSRAREFYIKYVSSVIGSGDPVVAGELVVIASAINFLLISDGSAVLRYST